MRMFSTLAAVTAITAIAADAHAQTVPDSVATRLLAPAIFSAIADLAASAALSATTQAVSMQFPPGRSWERVAAHVAVAVKARARIPADTTERLVHVKGLHFANDTLHAQIDVGVRWKCGSQWRGNTATKYVAAVRHGSGWQAAATLAEDRAHARPCN